MLRKYFTSSALVSLIILSSVFSVLYPSNNASAVNEGGGSSDISPYQKMSPTDQASSNIYYYAISLCIGGTVLRDGFNHDQITQEHAASGEWFASSFANKEYTSPRIGYYLGSNSDDGYVNCNSGQLVTNAFNLWGYTDLKQALCDSGAQRWDKPRDKGCESNDGKYTGKPGGVTQKLDLAKFQSAIRRKVYGSQEPTAFRKNGSDMAKAAQYVEDLSVFFTGCIGEASPQPSTGGNKKYTYSIHYVDPSAGSIESATYYAGGKNGKSRDTTISYLSGATGSQVSHTCAELESQINKNADAYIAIVTKLGGDVETVAKSSPVSGVSKKSMSSCVIEGVGWMICPVMKLIGSVADNSYSVISSLLSLNPALVKADDTSGTYVAWQFFRSIANVLFVVAFLVIIMSQLTSVGISNYGVKKLLPRLIVTAILVNISFYICQIMVDLSEILGHTLNQFLGEAIPSQIKIAAVKPTWVEIIGGILAGTVTIAGLAVLAAAGIAAVGLSVSIPVVLMVLLSVFLTFIILIGRQAVIVVLVVISPLALVAYLLPNTEQWFRKWGKMLVSLLMVYPVVSLLYGAGKLTGMIIYKANPDNFFMQISALGVTAIPLIATPSLLKGALNSTGALGAKLSGWSSKANGAIGARAKDSSTLGTTLSDIGNYRNQKRQIMLAKRRAGGGRVMGRVNPLLNRLGGKGYDDRVSRMGKSLEDKEFEDKVATASLEHATMSRNDLMQKAMHSTDEAERTAAIRNIMKTGNFDERRQVLEQSSTAGSRSGAAIREGFYSSGDSKVYGAKMGDDILGGSVTASSLKNMLDSQISSGKISGETMSKDANIADQVFMAASSPTMDPEAIRKISEQASVALASELRSSMTPEIVQKLEKIQAMYRPPAAGPPSP